MDAQIADSEPERVDRWLAAISKAKPAGENVRHDPDHEALRTAVANLEGLAGAPIDWVAFSSQAEVLVTTRSKDLLIASYFAYGLLQTEGLHGLAQGLALISAIIERYWDTCFPDVARVRARANALSWLIERASRQLKETGSASDFRALAAVAEQTERLQKAVASRFDGEAIVFGPLLEAIGEQQPSSAASGAPAMPSATPPAPSMQSAVPQGRDIPEVPPAAGQVDPPGGTLPVASSDPVDAKLAELARPFATPIPGSSRGGENARNDPKHEAVRREIAKLNRATAEAVDWTFIRDSARALLEQESKDLVVACYFAVASYVLDGAGGLVQGMAAISALLRDYWDDGYPSVKRLRARVNAIDWFVERLSSLGHLAPTNVAEDNFQLLSRAAADLQSLVLDRFDDEVPNIYGLKETLGRIELSLAKQPTAAPLATQSEAPQPKSETEAPATPAQPEPPPPEPPAPQPSPPQPKTEVDLAVPSEPLTDPAQVKTFLRTVGTSLHTASKAFFQASSKDPLSYRMARRGIYLPYLDAPAAASGNRTAVPSPSRFEETETRLNRLLSAKDWPKLLEQAESSLSKFRFWLDVHRYVAVALAGLEYTDAREAVVAETLALAQRLPGLLEREFSDGRPFASAETREWLSAAAPGAPSSSAEVPTTDGLDQQLNEAQQLALGGKLEEAVTALTAIAHGPGMSARDRFRAKLAMAKSCSAAKAHRLAEGILTGLVAEIEEFRIEEWEPKIAESCYRARYEALSAMGIQSAESQQALAEAYRQLCRVTPLGALKLG